MINGWTGLDLVMDISWFSMNSAEQSRNFVLLAKQAAGEGATGLAGFGRWRSLAGLNLLTWFANGRQPSLSDQDRNFGS
jgi:hypothetical protein